MRRLTLLFVVSFATTSAWSQGLMMGLTGKAMLAQMPAVKKELKITKDEEKAINDLMAQASKNPTAYAGGIDMHYMTRSIDAKVMELLDDAQRARLQELFLQYNGLMTLTEDDVCSALAIDDGTKEKAAARIKEHDKQSMDLMMEVQHTHKFDEKKMKAVDDQAQADLLAMLTPAQAEKWKSMLGKEFKFPKMGH